MGLSIWELLIILVIIALLFGTRKLGTMGGDLGNAIKGFRKAIKEEDDADESHGGRKDRNTATAADPDEAGRPQAKDKPEP